ncbi:FecR family protein [Pedobacter nyackensis]|uniref:FecR family protein n=1 Tax=Pedobacter nyackensis TaxID=475255 RepID=UPI00292FFD33|nr:FecR domain-containing protein [Pedobacter nyackensis]
MEQENQHIKYISTLISKYLDNSISVEESAVLSEWEAATPENKLIFDELKDQRQLELTLKNLLAVDTEASLARLKITMNADVVPLNPKNKKWNWIRLTGIAASIVLVCFTGFYFYKTIYAPKQHNNNLSVNDILPGANKAVLTLANGRTIDLNSTKEGVVFKADELIYNDGSAIEPENPHQGKLTDQAYDMVLSTPKGGQYSLVLSDGTKVWLNAGSTLRFPGKFEGKLRKVELMGEAYFEVRPNAAKPFKVYSKGQEISVLGTVFNINAYGDEIGTKTTLVQGKVMVTATDLNGGLNKNAVLLPGQESTLTKSEDIIIRKADVATAISWKSGVFKFYETELHIVMNQLSRWYDLDVEYQGSIPETYAYGEISRNSKLGDVLDILKTGGLNFKIVQRGKSKVLIVLPDK